MTSYDTNLIQRTVFGVLLERHPAMLDTGEVTAALEDIPEKDVRAAITLLQRHGVVNTLGNRVGVSGAALRTTQLTL